MLHARLVLSAVVFLASTVAAQGSAPARSPRARAIPERAGPRIARQAAQAPGEDQARRAGGIELFPMPFNPVAQFGTSVALDGATAIVGAPSGTYDNLDRAHVFDSTASGWVQTDLLLQAQPNPIDETRKTGRSVALDGDVAALGAWGGAARNECNFADTLQIFRRSGPTWVEEFRRSVSFCDESWATHLAVSGDTVLVASTGTLLLTGSVTVYRNGVGGWKQETVLGSPAPFTQDDEFGESVALEGDTMLVGAPGTVVNGAPAGAVYVYARTGSTWTQVDRWVPSDSRANQDFGASVALSGNLALVGASMDSENGKWAGAVYVFEQLGGQWVEREKCMTTPGSIFFGSAVDLDGDWAIVGGSQYASSLHRTSGSFSEVVHYVQPGRIFFGSAVSLSGTTALIGAPGGFRSPGGAFVFDLTAGSAPR